MVFPLLRTWSAVPDKAEPARSQGRETRQVVPGGVCRCVGAPGGHRLPRLAAEELAQRRRALEPAEIGYCLDLLVGVAQQLLRAFEAHSLYGFENRLPSRSSEAHFGVDTRTGIVIAALAPVRRKSGFTDVSVGDVFSQTLA